MDHPENFIDNHNDSQSIGVTFNGYGNRVVIHRIDKIQSLSIEVNGDNNTIMIGSSPRFGNVRMIVQDGSSVLIGEGTTIEGAYFLARDKTSIQVGRDCMLSFQLDLRTSDAHGIYDLDDGRRLNNALPISIGDHVWIGQAATISKGARIGSGAVVGFGAYVQKMYVSPNSVVAGAPAREVRKGIIWDRGSADNIFSCDEKYVDHKLLNWSGELRDKRAAFAQRD